MTTTMRTESELFNGWKNYETWNVSLWIQNEFVLYREACGIVMDGGKYQDFVKLMQEMGCTHTPDGVQWDDVNIDGLEINEMMQELIA